MSASFHFVISSLKSAFFALFYTKLESIEFLKNEKSPGIVLEKSWNSVFRFPYEP